jgi:CHAD domain-containing protein
MKSLKLAIEKELKAAIEEGEQVEIGLENRVHSVRRRCKRLRAYLHLLPPAYAPLGKRLRGRIRLAASSLSSLRDRHVMRVSFRRLKEALAAEGFSGAPLERLSGYVQGRIERIGRLEAPPEQQVEGMLEALRQARRRMRKVAAGIDRQASLDQFIQSYRRARQALDQVLRRGNAADFHELRKIVKRWQYQGQWLFSDAVDFTEDLRRAHDLEEQLGATLDLVVLMHSIFEPDAATTDRDLAGIISRGRLELKKRTQAMFEACIPLACRLFHHRTRRFAKRCRQA